ncbi:transglutaminase family protein [Sphingobacterium paramultivorum]|uniref:Transglutaminase family protein n=1 Tax=Sphingobacterium paramultivorum TaxID=2886510 RepID=A0A7G5DZ39_9SPHI|nr:transglutaminase family protein [Sphingobacterium paramultivorum]QMV67014.1 transglutaminase family protein [Sphingobacterium paramultivorum]WSO15856.1 transglutaminase family protein [Sphingobacterium paramultivorum]
MNNYLKETKILDYSHDSIQKLVNEREWNQLDMISRIKAIYNFVRDEIKFGYNLSDNISASAVLKDGYGQCNTKATLLMALLRATEIPNRIHGFTIDKALQKGAITGIWYKLSPKNILHSWVEILVDEQWYFLEGVILDKIYLAKLQEKNSDCKTTFCGYGAYSDNFKNPPIDWDLNNTFIQDKGINQDFGLFDTPDEFYEQHQQKLNVFERFVFKNIVRHKMNKNVAKIRNGR